MFVRNKNINSLLLVNTNLAAKYPKLETRSYIMHPLFFKCRKVKKCHHVSFNFRKDLYSNPLFNVSFVNLVGTRNSLKCGNKFLNRFEWTFTLSIATTFMSYFNEYVNKNNHDK